MKLLNLLKYFAYMAKYINPTWLVPVKKEEKKIQITTCKIESNAAYISSFLGCKYHFNNGVYAVIGTPSQKQKLENEINFANALNIIKGHLVEVPTKH